MKTSSGSRLQPRTLCAVLAVLMLPLIACAMAVETREIPAPAEDPASHATTATAVFAGGCFWGVQAVFQHVDGVLSAISGYAGGDAGTAQYERVSRGDTGHAESVQVRYDPRKISFGQLMRIYFSVAHDPTQLNRQGPDRGTQYRSAIFAQDDQQSSLAKAYIAQLDAARVFPTAIVTKIETGRNFYAAEDYHQDFLTLHPSNAYIVVNDLPKLAALKQYFPDRYRERPVLVGAARPH